MKMRKLIQVLEQSSTLTFNNEWMDSQPPHETLPSWRPRTGGAHRILGNPFHSNKRKLQTNRKQKDLSETAHPERLLRKRLLHGLLPTIVPAVCEVPDCVRKMLCLQEKHGRCNCSMHMLWPEISDLKKGLEREHGISSYEHEIKRVSAQSKELLSFHPHVRMCTRETTESSSPPSTHGAGVGQPRHLEVAYRVQHPANSVSPCL